MLRATLSSIFLIILPIQGLSQEQGSQGDCSPNISGADGNVIINCFGGNNSTISRPVDDDQNKSADILEAVQGDWFSPQFRYGFSISEKVGIATLSNAPNVYKAGDEMLRIDFVGPNEIVGQQIYTDGVWRNVSIELLDEEMFMEGGGFRWRMVRPQ